MMQQIAVGLVRGNAGAAGSGDVAARDGLAMSSAKKPQETRDWAGVERSESVIDEMYWSSRRRREEQEDARRVLTTEGVLIYRNSNRLRPIVSTLSYVGPLSTGSYLFYAKCAGDLPFEETPWLAIGAMFVLGAVMRVTSRTVATLTARDMYLSKGGTELHVRSYNHWFWGFGPLVRFQTKSVVEKVQDPPTNTRLLHVKGDNGPYLLLYRDAHTPFAELYESVLRGDGADTSAVMSAASASSDPVATAGSSPATPTPTLTSAPQATATVTSTTTTTTTTAETPTPVGEWREAQDDKGRRYFWNTVTRETRWTRPVVPPKPEA